MKYVKMLGLLAVAAAALMAFSGPASATTLTDKAGSVLGVGTHIEATSTNTQLHGSVTVSCAKSIVTGSITNAGGAGKSVEGPISTLDFLECGKDTVSTLKSGSLAIHATSGSTGEMTSTGAEVTVQIHRTILGFPVTTHCIYQTNATPIGEFTESDNTPGFTTATFHADADLNPETDGACGSSANWTGTYTIDTPDHIYIDQN